MRLTGVEREAQWSELRDALGKTKKVTPELSLQNSTDGDAATRFMLLVAAKRMSRVRLARATDIPRHRLDHFVNGVSDHPFFRNSECMLIAEAFGMLRSAFVAWWSTGDDSMVPEYVVMQMREFDALPASEKKARLKDLGWQPQDLPQ